MVTAGIGSDDERDEETRSETKRDGDWATVARKRTQNKGENWRAANKCDVKVRERARGRKERRESKSDERREGKAKGRSDESGVT